MADISDYTSLITSEHRDKPKFMAMVQMLAQCFVDLRNAADGLPAQFDLDDAVGVQLDVIGLWVGVSRNIKTPLSGVYFALDTDGVGFDAGVWQRPFDPSSGITQLDDDSYRLLLKAKIGANRWDGTLGGAAPILSLIFGGGTLPFIQDNQDMSMDIGLAGEPPTVLFQALLTGGYLPLKPAGVRVSYYLLPTGEGPLFSFDIDNEYGAGFDTGSFAQLVAAT